MRAFERAFGSRIGQCCALVVFLSTLGSVQVATAANIVPVSATGTSATFTNLINGVGLSGGYPYVGVTHAGTGNNIGNSANPCCAESPITFDLGGTFDLTKMYFWNYTHEGFDFYIGRDVDNLDIYLSTDGSVFTFYGNIQPAALGNASGGPEPMQEFALVGTASHVQLHVLDIQGGIGHGAEWGMGEVRFDGTPASIPEPAGIVLAAMGLVGLGWFVGRRRA